MPYKGSYVWKIRQKIGHDLLIAPSADALAVDEAGRILLIFNKDFNRWCPPGGYAEAGQSSAECAVRELAEEGGIVANPADLVPFAFVSGHTATYANGDVTQPFTQCFFVTKWSDAGEDLDTEEVSERRWFSVQEIDQFQDNPHIKKTIDAYKIFLKTGQYQMIDGEDM